MLMRKRIRLMGFCFLFFAGIWSVLIPGHAYAKSRSGRKAGVRITASKEILVGEKVTIKVTNAGRHKVHFQINRKGQGHVSIINRGKNSIVIKGEKPGIVRLAARFRGGKVLKTTVKIEDDRKTFKLDRQEMVIDGGDYGKICAYYGDRCVSPKTSWIVSDTGGLYLGSFGAAGQQDSWEANTVYGIKPGAYSIQAEYHGKKAVCKVFVKQTSDRWKEWCLLKERAEKYQKTVKSAVKDSVRSGMSDLEKAKVLAEWICHNLDYDPTCEKNSEEEAFVDRISACEGYAEAYNVLLHIVGIRSCVVHGRAYPKKKSRKYESHAWNIVLIDGEWYHVDVTWMDRGKKKISYKSFMKSSSYFGKKNPKRKKWRVEYYNFPELAEYLHTTPETGKRFDKVTRKKWKNGDWKNY